MKCPRLHGRHLIRCAYCLFIVLLAVVGASWAGLLPSKSEVVIQVIHRADGTSERLSQDEAWYTRGPEPGSELRLRRWQFQRADGGIIISLTSMRYSVGTKEAIESYSIDEMRRVMIGSSDGAELYRRMYRFPLSDVGWDDTDSVKGVKTSFVRTHDRFRQGWDAQLRVAYWLLLVILASPILLIGVPRYLMNRRRRTRLIAHRCVQCNYDLRASTTRCPECGHPIPTSTNPPPTPPPAEADSSS